MERFGKPPNTSDTQTQIYDLSILSQPDWTCCRKPVWAKLKTEAFAHLTGSLYTPMTLRAAQQTLQSRSLGFARLRLLPKQTGKTPHLLC